MREVRWMPTALEDLEAIREYIARDSVHYANKFVDEIFKITGLLEVFPESGRMIPELSDEKIREILHGSYRIIYRITEDKLSVLNIVHGRRLLYDAINRRD